MSFSRNVDPEKQEMLQMKLTFKAVEDHEKYLGLPTFVGGVKKEGVQKYSGADSKKIERVEGRIPISSRQGSAY